MSDLSFAIQIIASTIAAGASYALLMSVFKKEVNALWLKSETWCVFVFGLIAALSGGVRLLQNPVALVKVSGVLLCVGVVCTFGLVLLHLTKAKKVSVYPVELVSAAKFFSMTLFALFVGHILLELAGLASL